MGEKYIDMTEEQKNKLTEAGFIFVEQFNEYRVPVGRIGMHMHLSEQLILDIIELGEFETMLSELANESITEL